MAAMTFTRHLLPETPDSKPTEDRFKEVEVATAFKRIYCRACGLESIYKYRVKQIRRRTEIATTPDQEVREDHVALWQTIPRYAEVPETIRCKRCGEVLPQETLCLY